MKIVKNTSMQGLSIPFGTPKGVRTFFIAPKEQVEVPDGWESSVARNLVHRRMVRLTQVTDHVAATTVNQTLSKKTRKSS